MSMTGGVSFFQKNKALFADGATVTASSNNASASLMLGTDIYRRWESSGSDDTTTETITITLPSSQSISRIFLIDHNFKEFTIKYGTGTPSDFTGVTGLNSYSGSAITETTYAEDTAYYEFDSVTTDTIVITCLKTQTADAQKYLTQVIITNEIGTLAGFPDVSNVRVDQEIEKEKSISGRYHIRRSHETMNFNMRLGVYPYQADIDILDSLYELEEPFIAWLCGGKPENFRLKQRGWRLKDVRSMKIDNSLANGYYKNIYGLGAEQSYSFQEVL